MPFPCRSVLAVGFSKRFVDVEPLRAPSQSTYEVSTSNKYLIVLVRSSSFVILMSCDLLCVVNISARFDRNKPWNKKNNSTSIHSRGKQRTFMMMNRPASNLLLLRIIPQFQRCSEWNCPQWKKNQCDYSFIMLNTTRLAQLLRTLFCAIFCRVLLMAYAETSKKLNK